MSNFFVRFCTIYSPEQNDDIKQFYFNYCHPRPCGTSAFHTLISAYKSYSLTKLQHDDTIFMYFTDQSRFSNRGNSYYKTGQFQLLQIGAKLLQTGAELLQIGEGITNWGNYYKSVQSNWQISDRQNHIFQKSKSYEISGTRTDIYVGEDLEFIIRVFCWCITLDYEIYTTCKKKQKKQQHYLT